MSFPHATPSALLPAAAADWRAAAYVLVAVAASVLLGLYLVSAVRRGRRSRVGQRMTKGGGVFSLLTLAIAIVALHTKINFLVLVFGMLLSAFVLSFVLSRLTMRRLEFARALPTDVHAGEPLRVELRVTNRKRRLASYGLVVQDELPEGVSAEPPGGVVLELRSRQAASVPYTATAARRGVYAFRTVGYSTRFPFGLFQQGRARALPGELVVYPRLGEVSAQLLGRTRALALAQQRTRGARGEEEFRNLREYRPGDNPRRIHWKTSAKLGKPLVREMEAVVSERVLILLDTRCPASGEAALEAAISFAATLARDLMLRGLFVGLAAYAPELAVTAPAKSATGLRALFGTLARLEPNPERSLVELAAEPAVRGGGRLVTVVALRRRDADAEAALELLQRHQARVLAVDASAPEFREVFHLV
ncbi:MAG TPA: DUF58 domain-containing protein [Planctomycetota bacterium]|nr:DUF58 domain-containing protein [Planctomycetota bacterium]